MPFSEVLLIVNENKVPLNRFLKKLLGKILFSFASSLKGISEDDIKTITVKISVKDEET